MGRAVAPSTSRLGRTESTFGADDGEVAAAAAGRFGAVDEQLEPGRIEEIHVCDVDDKAASRGVPDELIPDGLDGDDVEIASEPSIGRKPVAGIEIEPHDFGEIHALRLGGLQTERQPPDRPESGPMGGAERARVRWLGRLFSEKRMELSLAAQCVELVGALRGPEAERAARAPGALVSVCRSATSYRAG
jgi:hypothetical protein